MAVSMILLDVLTYLGHLHPLTVHLPIGFLLLAVIFNLVSYLGKYDYLQQAVSFSLLMGFISAVLACLLGYLLSRTGDYDHKLLSGHKISAILLALVSGILYLTAIPQVRRWYALPPRPFSVLLVCLVLLMAYSGHQGAGLTHGSGYLDLGILSQHARQLPARVEDALVYEDVVQPVLESKCGSCHQGGKRKGGLSTQTLAGLLKGGRSGPAVVPGRPAESELCRRISLDPRDEKFMPSEGKPPLSPEETAVLRWWIEKAGAATGKRLSGFSDQEQVKPLIAAVLGMGDGGASAMAFSELPGPVNPDIPDQLDMTLVERLRKKGMVVRLMGHKPDRLDLTLPAGSGIPISTFAQDFPGIAKNTIWLNLSANGLKETDLGFLKNFTNLEKLRLEKNPLSDGVAGQVNALKNLTVINLNETAIGKPCLDKLQASASLKRIYCWHTAAAVFTPDSSGLIYR